MSGPSPRRTPRRHPAPARWLRAIYLPAAPPLWSLNHVGDEPTHRMLGPDPKVVPSFVMSFIPSLTSLEAVTPQATIQRPSLPERGLFPRRLAARDFTLRAYELGLPIGLSFSPFGYVFDGTHLEGLSPLSRLSYSPPETYSGRRASSRPFHGLAARFGVSPRTKLPAQAALNAPQGKRTPQTGLRRRNRHHPL